MASKETPGPSREKGTLTPNSECVIHDDSPQSTRYAKALNKLQSQGRNKGIQRPAEDSQSPSETLQRKKKMLLKSPNDLYDLRQLIGHGSFGKVYKAYAEISHSVVAIKIFNTDKKSLPRREFEICRLFKGMKNFVHALELFDYGSRSCLVLEYLDDTLSYCIKHYGPFSIRFVRPLVRQLLEALKILKEKSVIHGDLKPVNIMMDQWKSPHRTLKIIDFGASMYITQCSVDCVMQTKPYRAPEVIVGAPRDERIDMWSAGCIVAEMLAARCLYPGMEDRDLLAMISKCQGPLPETVLYKGIHTYNLYNVVSKDGGENELAGGLLPTPSTLKGYYEFQTNNVNELVEFDHDATSEEKVQMLSLVKAMLHLDADFRCTPEEALEHQYFKMEFAGASGDLR